MKTSGHKTDFYDSKKRRGDNVILVLLYFIPYSICPRRYRDAIERYLCQVLERKQLQKVSILIFTF